MKLAANLTLTFLAIALVIAAVGVLIFLNSKNIGESFNQLNKESVPQIISLQQMRTDSITVYSRALEYTVENNQTELQDYRNEIAEAEQDFSRTFKSFESIASPLDRVHDQQSMTLLQLDWNDFVSKSDYVLKIVDERADKETISDARETMEHAQEKFDSTLDNALKQELKQSQAFGLAVDDAQRISFILIVIGFGTAAIFAVTLGNIIARRISVPISQLRNTLDDLAHGKYDSEIPKARFDEFGDLVTHFGIVRAQLKEEDQLKNEFVNLAAHELRTPVLPIILTAEELTDEINDEASRQKLERIVRNAHRLNKLTKDILDVSRLESKSFKLQKEKTNIKNLTLDVIQDATLKIPETQNVKIVFECALPEEKQAIMIDKGRISEVLVNLLDNAINFTTNGTINIRLEESKPSQDNFIQIKVVDTGKGIDESVKDKLFQKFVTKSEKARGTGLGLYICKGIVEAHGGKIWAANNGNGKGATFTFNLPI